MLKTGDEQGVSSKCKPEGTELAVFILGRSEIPGQKILRMQGQLIPLQSSLHVEDIIMKLHAIKNILSI